MARKGERHWHQPATVEPMGSRDSAREREFAQRRRWAEWRGGSFRPMRPYEDAVTDDGGLQRLDKPLMRHRSLVGGSL